MRPYIVSRPGKQGGRACLNGTRMPARQVAEMVRDGWNVRSPDLFPWLTEEQVRTCVNWYAQQRGEPGDE